VAVTGTRDLFEGGEVAVVAGVGPGMGRSIAVGLATHGVDVVLAARRRGRLDAVADEIRGLGRDPLVVPTDLADADACQNLVRLAVERFGGVDLLVQNGHAEGDWTPADEADPDSWREVFEVNLFGALHLAQAVIPSMRERGGGAMVFVNSGAALHNPARMGAYATSKAALASLTRTLAVENGRWGIRVNGVHLGAVEGETLAAAADKASAGSGLSAEAWLARKAEDFALGFVPTPDQCAGTVLFLCSKLATPVTGTHVAVNGGQWIH
jgi:NAD(P)-dependent dehydrogenase (short-subunit alcohol dehydrogenase family)